MFVLYSCDVGSTVGGACERNISLTAKCGHAFTRKDGLTYYFNCGPNHICYQLQCYNYVPYPAIITRCNLAGLDIQGGKCKDGTVTWYCPKNLTCENTVV